MKRFSNLKLNEACVSSDVNPGNAFAQTGVANHYSPIENIVTNARNLYCLRLGVVASVAEDGVSLKLNSTKFINKQEVYKVLNNVLYNDGMGLASYIQSQGLDKVSLVNLGQYIVVYFSPSDIKTAEPGVEPAPCQEMLQLGLYEAELIDASFINESDDEEVELEDETKKSLMELIKSPDKVKAAKNFATIIAKEVALPDDYYFAGVKDSDEAESIALRWRYIKRRPHNKSANCTRSLMNIYGDGKDAVWVQDYDKNAMFQLPKETKDLIEHILDTLGADETDDPCVFSIGGDKKKDESSSAASSEGSSAASSEGSSAEESSSSSSEESSSSSGGDDLLG